MRIGYKAVLAIAFLSCTTAIAQTPATKSVLGTVSSFNKDAKTLDVRPDNGAPVPVKLLGNTLVQRIAPGQTSLANATTIQPSDIATGDRVLVTVASNGADALRVVVISAADIAKRDDADREDWNKRGISGIVASTTGNQVLLQTIKTPSGDAQGVITVSDKTKILRYSPDSVRFADAQIGKLDEISAGDQIRARGMKSAATAVDAEEIVFGTFLTKAGSVTAVDAAAREVTFKELGSGKTIFIKLTSDSTIKQMPAAADDGRGQGAAAGNLSQMIDRLPAGKIDDIKPGTSIVVSSTKGSEADKLTAIVIVSNADQLIRMASTPSGRGGTLVFGNGDGIGLTVLGLQ